MLCTTQLCKQPLRLSDIGTYALQEIELSTEPAMERARQLVHDIRKRKLYRCVPVVAQRRLPLLLGVHWSSSLLNIDFLLVPTGPADIVFVCCCFCCC